MSYKCVVSYAQTNVSGFISANTIWNLAGSPYIVIGNTILLHGNTLTIDPGVLIKFDSDKVLEIDGELIAIGTAESRIKFTSNQSIPAAGDWGKIQFADTSVDATFDASGNYLSGSIMKYCDVLYGGSIGFGAVHLSIASPYISHCLISYSTSDGIYCSQRNFLIDSSAVRNCTNIGVSFNSLPFNNSQVKIYSDTIENNAQGGIYFSGLPIQSLDVRYCYFISNHYWGALNSGVALMSATISENYFANNTTNNLYGATVFFQGAANYTIACNKFINNQSGGNSTLGIANNSAGTGNYIINNIFQGNTSTNGCPVLFMQSNPQGTVHNTFISNNYISNNSSTTHPCINIISTCNLPVTSYMEHYIEHNTFVDNNTPSVFKFEIGNSQIGTNNFIHLNYNNFLNPLCQYEIDNAIPFSSPNIEADSNYWGTTSTQHVDSVINDFFDLGNLSVVFSSPILTLPTAIDTTCPVAIPTFVSNINSITASILLFPNPATTQFTVAFYKTIHAGNIQIYNIIGKEVLQENIYQASQKEINIQSISNGIYLVRLFDGEKYYCEKIVVQHD